MITGAERWTMVFTFLFIKVYMLRIFVVIIALAGCATRPDARSLTLEQLRRNTVVQADCPRIETIVQQLETNQQRAGIPRTNPESLPEPAREYQALTRINIWALRIGCSNPDYYKPL